MTLSEELRECAKTWTEDDWLEGWAKEADALQERIMELEVDLANARK